MAHDAERTLPLDPEVKQRRASDPGCSVWVGASAGTGKTKVLTDRVLRLMLAGTPPERILCLTFTKAAAAEMSIRINRTLARWATASDADLDHRLSDLTGERPSAALRTTARRLFARVVDCPGGMKIQTIHAFCGSLLRRFPLEARLAPHFEVMDDRTATELLESARDAVVRRARSEPDTDLGRALGRITGEVGQEDFAAILGDLTAQRGQLRRILDRHGGLEGTIAAVRDHLGVAPDDDEAAIIEAACREDAFDMPALRAACAALAGGTAKDGERGVAIQAWLDAAERRVETFETYKTVFLTREGQPRADRNLLTSKPAAASPEALEALRAEAARIVAVLERFKAVSVASATAALLVLADALLATYAALKERRSLLDYDDLILTTRRLLSEPGVSPWVLFKLDGGLDHVLIDEAQDTNPDQWQVVAALTEEFFSGSGARDDVRTVFAVGDEKQSIFSFQRADPAEFARMRRHFAERTQAADRQWAQVALDISFRSTGAVLRTVDEVFADDAARDGVVLEATRIEHVAFRRGQAGLVELWPPVKPLDRAALEAWSPPIASERADSPSARLAGVIANRIRAWLDEGERLESHGRPVRPGDIMVLVRRRTGFVEELVRALKDRDVPVAGIDRMVLTGQLAVMDLMALARFLLLPEDDLTLATVLKSPLIGLCEDRLFAVAHGRPGSLWQALRAKAERDPELAPAHAYLAGLLARTDFTAPYELFDGLLSAPCPADTVSGRRAILRRLGPEAQDPLDEFLAACLMFERGHVPSLQGFLHWLETSETEIKRELEQGGGRVRIMTVHGSKGLQAPIVFMPDTATLPSQGPRILWPDGGHAVPLFAPRRHLEERRCAEARARADTRRDQEYRRLLYVALTRAEDRLYVCGWQGKKELQDGCWYRLVEAALERIGEPVEFDFTTLSPDGWTGTGYRLRNRQDAEPKGDGLTARTDAVAAPLPDWARVAAPAEPAPSRPLTPSRPDEPEPAVRSPIGPDDGARFRRGNLIHRLLQTLPDLPPDARETAAARFLAQPAHGLSPEEREAIAAETLAVLHHPEFAPIFGPGSRAEVPLVGVVGHRVLSGQIDRLLVTDDAVWIVDYKTNRPPPEVETAVHGVYLRQMAAYRAALAEIYPGRAVRCFLLWTDGPRLMPISGRLLDAHAP